MPTYNETITISAKVDITPAALEAVVENAKQLTGRNEKGHYRVDTAEKVNEMISKFLAKYDFESFAKDIDNYD